MRMRFGLLREFLQILAEEGEGARLDAEEAQAKAVYEKAQAALQTWEAEMAKKNAFIARAREMGLNPEGESARKKLRSQPEFAYDPKVVQKKRETLEKDLKKARDKYGAYDPSVTGYERARVTKKPGAQAQYPAKTAKVYMPIGSIKPNQLYKWDDPLWNKVVKGIPLGFTKGGTSDDKQSGTGPGEARLAVILGGHVQGGGTSFDITTQDERQWEVKGLKGPKDLVRPGTEGLAAFEKPRQRLMKLMKALRNFTIVVKKLGLADSAGEGDKKVFEFVKGFIDDEFEWIVGKGEISGDRFRSLRAALKAVSVLKQRWEQGGIEPDLDTTVGLGKKSVKVDRPTFVDVAKRVDKAAPDAGVLSAKDDMEIALSTIRDPAFDDPRIFFDEWFASVDVRRVFEQVDGVFIVTPEGFFLVPAELFKDSFKFVKVSQAKPKFAYAKYNVIDEAD